MPDTDTKPTVAEAAALRAALDEMNAKYAEVRAAFDAFAARFRATKDDLTDAEVDAICQAFLPVEDTMAGGDGA